MCMNFKDYFNIESVDVQKNCIICQVFDLSLFSDKSNNGFFVKTAQAQNTTVIALKNNFLAGDTALHLKDTECENILLFGSCGGCGDVESGDLLLIDKARNLESFSKMLSFDVNPETYSSSEELLKKFYEKNRYEDLIKTNSACVSSLLLESKYLPWFKDNGINAVDMESSIIYSAAQNAGKKALAVMYAADHIEATPFGKPVEEKVKNKISAARKKLARLLLDFTNEL